MVTHCSMWCSQAIYVGRCQQLYAAVGGGCIQQRNENVHHLWVVADFARNLQPEAQLLVRENTGLLVTHRGLQSWLRGKTERWLSPNTSGRACSCSQQTLLLTGKRQVVVAHQTVCIAASHHILGKVDDSQQEVGARELYLGIALCQVTLLVQGHAASALKEERGTQHSRAHVSHQNQS